MIKPAGTTSSAEYNLPWLRDVFREKINVYHLEKYSCPCLPSVGFDAVGPSLRVRVKQFDKNALKPICTSCFDKFETGEKWRENIPA